MDIAPQASKSITDQIIDETFKKIKSSDEFPDSLIQKLNDLSSKGQLKNSTKLIEYIKSEGCKNEDSKT